jgi:hypothetical protein
VGLRDRARASLRAHSLIDCEPIGFRNNGSYKRAELRPVGGWPTAGGGRKWLESLCVSSMGPGIQDWILVLVLGLYI